MHRHGQKIGKRYIFCISILYTPASFDMMRPAYRDRCFASKASGGVPERPKGADCKSAVTDFEGSNPSPTTIFSLLMRAQRKLKLHKTRREKMRSFDKVRAERRKTTRFSEVTLKTKRHRNLADFLLNKQVQP
jgi:hypothetical protein